MKKILSLIIIGSLSMGTVSCLSAMGKLSNAVKRSALCLVQPQKNNCTQAEITTARNWAAGLSLTALTGILLTVAGIGYSRPGSSEKKDPTRDLSSEAKAQNEPKINDMTQLKFNTSTGRIYIETKTGGLRHAGRATFVPRDQANEYSELDEVTELGTNEKALVSGLKFTELHD